MQYRSVEHIRQKGLELRQNGLTWDWIASKLGILTADDKINPGLAYRMVMEGYDPKRIETRTRLRLPPVCPTCHRPLQKVRQRRERKLTEIPDKELLRMFMEREDVI